MQITTQRAHQFCALVRQERKSFNRKSKEVAKLRLIYYMYVERGAMSRPANGKGNYDLSVVKLAFPVRKEKLDKQFRFLCDFLAC